MARTHLRGRSTRRPWRGLAATATLLTITMAALVGWAPALGASPAATPPTAALLEAVGVFAQSGHDQVVFQFTDNVPGYKLTVVSKPIHADPSDQVVPIAGNAVVQVTMSPASGVDLTKPDAPRTYTGPTRITLNGKAVVEVVQTGDFEGVLTWDVGLTEQVPFVALTATNPARLAIDFQDPSEVTANPTFTG